VLLEVVLLEGGATRYAVVDLAGSTADEQAGEAARAKRESTKLVGRSEVGFGADGRRGEARGDALERVGL